MTRIRNPSQSKSMYRPNVIQKIRGSHYDDQSVPLNINVQLILNFFAGKPSIYQSLEETGMRFIRAAP